MTDQPGGLESIWAQAGAVLVMISAAGLIVKAVWTQYIETLKKKDDDNEQNRDALIAMNKEMQVQMSAVAQGLQSIEKAFTAAIENLRRGRGNKDDNQ